MKSKQQPQVLQVLLYRKDEVEPIVIMESDKFAECKKVWKGLIDKWTKAHKEAEPFILESPIVTAIEPQLNVDPNNPYNQNMLNNGLAQTMRGVSNIPGQIFDTNAGGGYTYGELTDNGYK